MSIPSTARIPGLQQPSQNPPLVDPQTGNLTILGFSVLDQIYHFVNGTSRNIPCNASTAANVISLTIAENGMRVKQYADFDVYQFVADATSTGSVTASVTTPDGALSTLKVFITNGASQAGAGNITSGRQYELTYVDSLDGGAGGFVLR